MKKEYDQKLEKYKSDLKAYEDKVAEGQKKVEELNSRFGDWYYVISGADFRKLRPQKKDLIKG